MGKLERSVEKNIWYCESRRSRSIKRPTMPTMWKHIPSKRIDTTLLFQKMLCYVYKSAYAKTEINKTL
jgi:hypothetical protein